MTLAYWCVLIAALLPLGCAAYAKKTARFNFARDNGSPRDFLARLEGRAATGNAEQGTLNGLAVLFVLLRLAFIYCYLNDRPSLRSAAWSGAMLCTVLLFVAAV